MPRSRRLLIALCFFLSGAAGLIDEVVWSRYLHIIFGSTSYSIATVIATYMAGLGLGAWLMGGVADRTQHPARLYAWLELGIAGYALLSPVLLGGLQLLFVPLHRAFDPGPLPSALMKAALSALVLLVPTVLMGGTLPLLARDLVARGEEPARGIGLLYGINTLGAVAGSLISGFVLIERAGLIGSLAIAAALNVAAALLVLGLGSRRVAAAPVEPRAPVFALLRSEPVLLASGLALAAGLGSLASEVAWARLLALIIGSSTYSFSLVLAGFLLGIGFGSWWIGRRGAGADPLRALGWAQLLAALGVASVLWGLEPLLRVFTMFQQNPLAGFWSTLAFKALLVLVAVLPATLGMGMSFPLVAAAAGRGSRSVGAAVGLVYAANTIGAIAGSLLAGFFLITAAGTFATLRFAAWVHAAVAIAAFAVSLRGGGARRVLVPALGILCGALVLLGARPWPSHYLSLGLFLYPRGMVDSQIELDRYFAHGAVEQIYSREGLSSVISVWEVGYARALRNNGKTDAGTSTDMDTQVNLGLRPLLAHPAPRAVLVIGAGSGVTAAAVASDPGVERIDVVEIEGAVIDAGPLFSGVNRDVYLDPRVHVILEDGRNHLLTTTQRYDLIISEPSNPWMAGVSNLFTSEFYALVRSRLAPGGVLCQWVQIYDIRSDTVRRMSATVAAAFAHAEVWISGKSDIQFLAADGAIEIRPERAEGLFAAPRSYVREFASVIRAEDAEDLRVGRLLDRDGILVFAGGREPYRDDPPKLEFEALRALGEHAWGKRLLLDLRQARERKPPLVATGAAAGFADYDEGRIRLWLDDGAGARVAFEGAAGVRGLAKDWVWLGDAYQLAGENASAYDAWSRAIEVSPRHPRARSRLAEAALVARDAAQARAQIEAVPPSERDTEMVLLDARAAASGGDAASALLRLREGTLRLSETREAPRLLERVLAMYLQLGADPGLAPEVIKEVERHARAAPRALEWATVLGQIHEQHGSREQALAWYDRALVGGPEAHVLAGRARCLHGLGRRDEARAALERLRHYQPWSVDVYQLDRAMAAAR